MPQNNPAIVSVGPTGTPSQMSVSQFGDVINSSGGLTPALNISAATVIKAVAGRLCRLSVITAGSTAGSVYDYNSTSSIPAGSLIASIPAATGMTQLDFPCSVGITVVPGTGQVLAVTYI